MGKRKRRSLFKAIKVRVRYLSIIINRVVRFITHDIWFLNADDMSRFKKRAVTDMRTVLLMMNTFSDQKIGFQVTALSYQSMMSIVPFLAIAFYLTGGLGLSDRLAEFLFTNIDNPTLIDNLLNAADHILLTAESGLFGLISMLSFLWILIWMMMSVRRVFNNVWKVPRERNFWKMLGVVFAVLLLSPFVIVLFFSGSVVYSHILDLIVPSKLAFSESLKTALSWITFAATAILILAAMYKYIPGTKVHYRHAFKAAIVSGILFTAVQYLYLETQVMVAKQSAVYGVLAAIPLFMIWLNIGWSIVLYGAELSYAFQNVKNAPAPVKRKEEKV